MIKKVLNILAVLIIVCSVISPAVAANSKEVSVLEVKAASKEKVTISEFTSTASGDSKVKSKDISLKTEKLDKSLKISSVEKTKSKSVDSHEILVPVADIQNFNGNSVRITHYDELGIQDDEYIQEVTVQDGYVLIPDVEFSSIVVDGFTGTKTEVSYNVNVTDTSFTVTENGSLTIALGGVDDGVSIEDGYLPENTLYASTFNGSSDNLAVGTGIIATDYNVSYNSDGSVDFNGIDSYILLTGFSGNFTSYSTFVKYNNTYDSANGRIFDSGYLVAPYGDNLYAAASSYSQRIGIRNTSGSFQYDDELVTSGEVFTGLVYDGNSVYYYYNDNVPYFSEAITGNIDSGDVAIGADIGLNYFFNNYIDSLYRINSVVNESDIRLMITEYSGTSAKLGENGEWQPVINGTVTFDDVTAGETVYLLSAYPTTADTLTKLYEYTQDYNVISETEDTNNVYVEAYAVAGANMTTSQLLYDVSSLNFTYNMSILSNNSNVTGTYHNGTVNLSTGYLNAGDSFNYSLTFDKLTYPFTYNVTWTSKTTTSASFNYSSNNSNVEQDIYLSNMSAGTYDLKYSNGTILMNATVADGWLKFEDTGGPTDTHKMVDGAYLIEKQTSATTFVGAIFVGLSFVGLYFANRFRRRNT